MATKRELWADNQVQELVALGDNLPDAQLWVDWLLTRIPETMDPDDYEMTVEDALALADIQDGDVRMSRVGWYESDAVPALFKRLLDATEESHG